MNSLLSITFLTLILVRIDIRQEEDTCWRTYSRRLPSGFAKQGYSSSWPNCGSKCSCGNELYEPSSRGHRRQGFVSRFNTIYTVQAFNVQPFPTVYIAAVTVISLLLVSETSSSLLTSYFPAFTFSAGISRLTWVISSISTMALRRFSKSFSYGSHYSTQKYLEVVDCRIQLIKGRKVDTHLPDSMQSCPANYPADSPEVYCCMGSKRDVWNIRYWSYALSIASIRKSSI